MVVKPFAYILKYKGICESDDTDTQFQQSCREQLESKSFHDWPQNTQTRDVFLEFIRRDVHLGVLVAGHFGIPS